MRRSYHAAAALRLTRVALITTAGIHLGGCAGPQIITETGYVLELESEDLSSVPAGNLDRAIQRDAKALRHVSDGFHALQARARASNDKLEARPGKYSQAENDGIRQLMLGYLSYRTELFRIVAYHSSYDSIADERRRLQSFFLAYTAGMTLYARGISIVEMFRDSPRARAKLNEPEPVWGIPPDVFDTVHENVTFRGNIRFLAENRDRATKLHAKAEAAGIFEDDLFRWMPAANERSWGVVEEMSPSIWQANWDKASREAKESGYSLWHDIQATLSVLAGDTRVSMAPPRVSKTTVRKLEPMLEPGDILVARHNFYVSNAFLPGFWPHAILYVGDADALQARGLGDRPWVSKHLDAYRRSASDGNPHRVIEAVSEGVVFSSLEYAAGADYLAVLRPRVRQARKDAAIERAFAHLGKPYDFEFDFFSTDQLVCTELVYRAYDEEIDGDRLEFSLVRMLGRDTYPAIEIVRMLEQEWNEDLEREERGEPPVRQLDFIAFLDGNRWRSQEELFATTHIPATPDRKGWTAGLGLGGGGVDAVGAGAVADTAFALSLRVGHSLGWRWLLMYDLEAATFTAPADDPGNADATDQTAWRLGHYGLIQWHPTRSLFFKTGVGVAHTARADELGALGPAWLVGLGYELVSAYGWAVDLQGGYSVAWSSEFTDPDSALTATLGFQLY